MKTIFISKLILLLFILGPQSIFASRINILESLELYYTIHPKKKSFGDITPHKEIIDIPNGYYAQTFSFDSGKNMLPVNLFEATIFRNTDKTTTLVVTEFEADEQCSWHVTTFFEISLDGKKITEIEKYKILPKIEWTELCNNEAIEVVRYYLPILKGSYLSENATFDELMNEFYDTYFQLPQLGTSMKVSMTVCDYIPTNEISMPEEKWKAIENGSKILLLNYNKKKKIFEIQ